MDSFYKNVSIYSAFILFVVIWIVLLYLENNSIPDVGNTVPGLYCCSVCSIYSGGELNMCKENCDKCLEDKSCCNGTYHTLDEDTFYRLLEPCDEFYDVIEDGDL